jgi:hypothetical protein
MDPPLSSPPMWVSLAPLCIHTLLFAGIMIWLAPKNGQPWPIALLGLIPLL